jgi:hypothetical protein
MEAEFLSACMQGDLETVKRLKAEEHAITTTVDLEGYNGVHIAVKHGQWAAAYYLIRDLKVSPFKCSLNGDTLYHTIIRKCAVSPPIALDFSAMRQEKEDTWRAEEEKLRTKHADLQPPESLITPLSSKSAEYFDNPMHTLPLLLLKGYHLSLREVNCDGDTPSSLAQKLGVDDLVGFFEHQSLPSQQTRRLVEGLNPNLFRQVVLLL